MHFHTATEQGRQTFRSGLGRAVQGVGFGHGDGAWSFRFRMVLQMRKFDISMTSDLCPASHTCVSWRFDS